jgi:hypothetical protein
VAKEQNLANRGGLPSHQHSFASSHGKLRGLPGIWPGEDRSNFRQDTEVRDLFAWLINAKPGEIAFVQSTTDAENIVVAGMSIGDTKGNVVIDELHYQASKFLYHVLEKEGRI